jgi:hypothetical protein
MLNFVVSTYMPNKKFGAGIVGARAVGYGAVGAGALGAGAASCCGPAPPKGCSSLLLRLLSTD